MTRAVAQVDTRIEAQPGPQTAFLSSPADIVIFGGAAGGGKSWALLIEPLRHHDNSRFGGVIFRRTSVQIRNEGGLWDASQLIYPTQGAKPREMSLEWFFPSGARMTFAHLEHEKSVFNYQGAEVPYIGFDELTHFTEFQFWYMLSRNRSTSGVRPYIRATCNADCDSWVRQLIDWWIGPDGLPIPERSGVLRWFVRTGDTLVWGNSPEELAAQFGPEHPPKSLTFIPSKLSDNKILMQKDPGYIANLMALDRVSRERLLEGNWNSRPSAGAYFRREWFEVLETYPTDIVKTVRYWDRAATKPSEGNKDPDWTVGVLLHKLSSGRWCIGDVRRVRESALRVEQLVKAIAQNDGQFTTVWIEQDPGSAGKSDVENMARLLAGHRVKIAKPTKDKLTRALPVSAQCEAGNVKVMRGAWNNSFFSELEGFPDGSHDDQVDALSGAFNAIIQSASVFEAL